MSSTVISHDAFGRFSIIRRTVKTKQTCHYCGQANPKGKLFQYGIHYDDRNRDEWGDSKLFCSKSCHDAYHG